MVYMVGILAQQISESGDVGLGHLEGLVLGQLAVVSQAGKVLAESVEGLVEVLHTATFAGIGRQAALPLHHGRNLLAAPLPLRLSANNDRGSNFALNDL